MAKNRSAAEIKLLEAGWGVLTGFVHLLVTLAAKMNLPAGTLYCLGTPEGQETLLAATKAFLAEVAKTVVPVWRTVTSGPTRDRLAAEAEVKGWIITDRALQLLTQITVTTGATYRLAVIRGDKFTTDEERTYTNICALAESLGCCKVPVEVALLLAQWSQSELGYQYLVVMHDLISNSENVPHVLALHRRGLDGGWMDAWGVDPVTQFNRGYAFVFLAPQEAEI